MEIGSEFWTKDQKYKSDNEELFLSGRTALDAIIKDISKNHQVTSALLPSYCCHSMIEPFLHNKISVRFYDVFLSDEGLLATTIPEPKKDEIFYDIKYFGSDTIIRNGVSDSAIRESWDYVIEDTTHSCFHMAHSFTADYEFTSYRKWMPLDGISVARKRSGKFFTKPQRWHTNEKYCEKRNLAFALKAAYMSGKAIQKAEFLQLFEEAEELLSKKYINLKPNLNTIIRYYTELHNLDHIRMVRLRNAKVLSDGLKDLQDVTVVLNMEDPQMCPLFVPIVVDPNTRNLLRQYLIEHEIYCPVHWPISAKHMGISSCAKRMYQTELSLICDQRYEEQDMERILTTIQEFFMRIKND